MGVGDDNTRSSKVGDAGESAADLATNVRSGGISGDGGGGVTKGSRVKALGAVAAWFVSTVILISSNKVLMREHFRLPVLLTFLHMIVSFAWCEFSSEMVRNVGDRGKGGWEEKRHKGNANLLLFPHHQLRTGRYVLRGESKMCPSNPSKTSNKPPWYHQSNQTSALCLTADAS